MNALSDAFFAAAKSHRDARLSQRDAQQAELAAQQEAKMAKRAEAERLGGEAGLALAIELETFDWYYDYSDDGRVWRAGAAKHDRFRALLPTIPNGEAIWLLYRPF